MYQIRKAMPEDLLRILQIYDHARQFMARTGNPFQWGRVHPPEDQLREDIRRQQLYVLCSAQAIHGVFFFAVGEDPTYRQIREGDWSSGQTYGTIHRIASDGSGGVLKACVEFCQAICPYLRIDTHADNLVMQNALKKLGFRRCGIIRIADGSPRLAYDRHIKTACIN